MCVTLFFSIKSVKYQYLNQITMTEMKWFYEKKSIKTFNLIVMAPVLVFQFNEKNLKTLHVKLLSCCVLVRNK